MEKNPLRVIDCKVPECKEIVKDAPRTIDYLDDECKAHFEELKSLLDALNIPYEVDTEIVRGLDYYTKTVFEFVNEDGFTLCGGGRYDNLVHEIDGKVSMPSVGFGMGVERILYFLEEEKVDLPCTRDIDLYVGILGQEAKAKAYQIVVDLRDQGFVVETDGFMGCASVQDFGKGQSMTLNFSSDVGDKKISYEVEFKADHAVRKIQIIEMNKDDVKIKKTAYISPKIKQYQMQKDTAYVIINEQLIGMKGQTINRQKIHSAKKNFTYKWKQLGDDGVLTPTDLKFKK